jgi:hypothetical protein
MLNLAVRKVSGRLADATIASRSVLYLVKVKIKNAAWSVVLICCLRVESFRVLNYFYRH